jgi:hypothetical protein
VTTGTRRLTRTSFDYEVEVNMPVCSNRLGHKWVYLAASCVVAGHATTALAVDNIYSWLGPPDALGNTSWSTLANWVNGTIPPLTPAAGDNSILWYGGALNLGTMQQNTTGGSSLDADYTFHQIVVDPYTIAGFPAAGTLTTTGAASRNIFLGAGGIISNTTGAATFNLHSASSATSRKLILTADQTWSHSNIDAIFIVRREIEGNFKITKQGAGTIELQGTNLNWTGGLDIQDGFIRTSTNTTVLGQGTISSISDNNTGISLSSTLDQTIAGPMILGGTGSFAFRGSNAVTVNNTVTLTSDKVVSTSVSNVTKPVTFNGSILGTGFVMTKTGSGGVMILKAANTNGGFVAGAGTLQADNDNQLGAAGAAMGLGTGAGSLQGIFQPTAAIDASPRAVNLNLTGGVIHTNGFATSFGAVSGTGPFGKDGDGVLTVASVQAPSLTITAGTLRIATNGGSLGTSVVKALSIAGDTLPTAKLDLEDNDLVIDYDVLAEASPIATITAQIIAGRASGSWNGNGIASSAAAGDASKALGVADNVTLNKTSFSGQTVDPTSVLVKFTYLGDSDLNGQVDVNDLGSLASSWQSAGGWVNGDFDYSGSVDVGDLGLLATNWQAGVGNPLGPSLVDALDALGLPSTSVPEPIGLGALLLGVWPLKRPRRRNS